MINMDQVRTLELKVKQAVQLIVHLRRENDQLRNRLSDTEVRLQDLETLLGSLKASQTEMEQGIKSALEELDQLEGQPRVDSQRPGPVESVAPAAEVPAVESAFEPDRSSSLTSAEASDDVFSPENEVYGEPESTESLELSVDEAKIDSVEFDLEEPELESTSEGASDSQTQDREQPGLGIF